MRVAASSQQYSPITVMFIPGANGSIAGFTITQNTTDPPNIQKQVAAFPPTNMPSTFAGRTKDTSPWKWILGVLGSACLLGGTIAGVGAIFKGQRGGDSLWRSFREGAIFSIAFDSIGALFELILGRLMLAFA